MYRKGNGHAGAAGRSARIAHPVFLAYKLHWRPIYTVSQKTSPIFYL